MNKFELEDYLREARPGGEFEWRSHKSLMVFGFHWPKIDDDDGEVGTYESAFALNLTQVDLPDPDFDLLNFWTRLSSSKPISLKFVNDLNHKTRFVRHVLFEDSNLDVMLDVAENSRELTPTVFNKYYTLFSMAVGRLKLAFPTD